MLIFTLIVGVFIMLWGFVVIATKHIGNDRESVTGGNAVGAGIVMFLTGLGFTILSVIKLLGE